MLRVPKPTTATLSPVRPSVRFSITSILSVCVAATLSEGRGSRWHDLQGRQGLRETPIIADQDEQIDHPRVSQPVLDRLICRVSNAMLPQQLQGELHDDRILRG